MVDINRLIALKTQLRYQFQLARKRCEAIDFIIRAKENLERVREEIRISAGNKRAREKDTIDGFTSLNDEQLEQTYLEQLQESLDFVQVELQKRDGYSEQITGILHKMAVPYDAIMDAIQFTIDSDFNKDLVNNEISETEDLINNPPESFVIAMHPGASPGIYQRNYLKTLKEIVQRLNE